MDCRKRLISYILTAGVIFNGVIQPADSIGSCIECHNDIWQIAQTKSYIHAPVAKKQCTSCHTGDIDGELQKSTQRQQTLSSVIADVDKQQQITWVAETFTPATQHFALLQPQLAGSTITIEAWSQQRNKLQFGLPVPPLPTMTKIEPFQPAKIAQIRLVDYNDLLLSHANIAWSTTSPCRCRVTYAARGSEYSLEEDDLYCNQHNIILHNCSGNDLLTITCTDPFGQQCNSEQMTIESLPHTDDSANGAETAPLSEQQIEITFKNLQQQIWLQLSALAKFSVSIGTTENQQAINRLQQQTTVDVTANVPEVPGTTVGNKEQTINSEHEKLLTPRAINLNICYGCHQNMLGWTSHPVDVVAPAGMIIPAEYPLLPDGRLSCMTCHSVHSSNKEYRLIKDSKRALCIGCHINY